RRTKIARSPAGDSVWGPTDNPVLGDNALKILTGWLATGDPTVKRAELEAIAQGARSCSTLGLELPTQDPTSLRKLLAVLDGKQNPATATVPGSILAARTRVNAALGERIVGTLELDGSQPWIRDLRDDRRRF